MAANRDSPLPGHEIVEQGLADLAQDQTTDFALLVLIAAPRLKALGMQIPARSFSRPCEHALYERLEERLGTAAYSHYNSLIRRMVSYTRALARQQRQTEPS